MKKYLKKLLIIFGILIAILIIVLLFSVSRIDKTPYFKTEYYQNTIKKLGGVLGNREITKGKLLAGFASINITPNIVKGDQNPSKGQFNNIRLAGFGDGKMAVSAHDSLYAKAVALKINDNLIILVSADLLFMPPEVVQKVEEKLKNDTDISREQLFYGATHTHASLGNCVPKFAGRLFGGEYQPKVINWLAEKISKLILKSVSDLKASQFASAYINAPDLIYNRLVGNKGRENDKLSIMSLKQINGKQAVIGVFAAHPTIISSWNDEFSGDYPGYFQRELENKGVDMAMFFAGTMASQTNYGKGAEKHIEAKYVGKSLADSAIHILKQMQYVDSAKISSISSEIEIPKLQAIYIADDLRLSPNVAQLLLPKLEPVHLQAFVLNNFLWITMPCELSGEYAIDLKNALELKGYNSVITSFNGQYLGYVIPAKYYFFDSYESRNMGWFGPSMGDYLMELNYMIADSLTGFKL